MAKAKPPASIDDQLRRAIEEDRRTAYRLAGDSGVDERIIRRFLAHTPRDETKPSKGRDITMATAARLAEALGLQLVRRR